MWCCMPELKSAVDSLLATLPEPVPLSDPSAHRRQWTHWQEGLRVKITCRRCCRRCACCWCADNLTGHHTPELVLWLFARG